MFLADGITNEIIEFYSLHKLQGSKLMAARMYSLVTLRTASIFNPDIPLKVRRVKGLLEASSGQEKCRTVFNLLQSVVRLHFWGNRLRPVAFMLAGFNFE